MINWINNLSDWQFVVFVLTIFLTLVQLTLFARAARGMAASFIPGILAMVGAVVLFAVTH